jgi:hypothetical protein
LDSLYKASISISSIRRREGLRISALPFSDSLLRSPPPSHPNVLPSPTISQFPFPPLVLIFSIFTPKLWYWKSNLPHSLIFPHPRFPLPVPASAHAPHVSLPFLLLYMQPISTSSNLVPLDLHVASTFGV